MDMNNAMSNVDELLDDGTGVMNGAGMDVNGAMGPPPAGANGEETFTVARRIYVGNLAWRTSWQDLKDHFAPCGNVIYADVMKLPDGRSKGCGIVEFDTPEAAAAAISSMGDSDLGGRPIFVREDREDKELKGAGGGQTYMGKRGRPGAAGGQGQPMQGQMQPQVSLPWLLQRPPCNLRCSSEPPPRPIRAIFLRPVRHNSLSRPLACVFTRLLLSRATSCTWAISLGKLPGRG